jgi:adenylate kinase
VQREDDTEEAIRNRLNSYHEETEPLKDFYEEKGILVTVDASKDIDEVTQEVLRPWEKTSNLDRPQEQERAGGDARGRQNHCRLPRAAL